MEKKIGYRKEYTCLYTREKIKRTLNNPEDRDEYWQLEAAIPFTSLPTLKGKIPKNGDTWLFHLSRYDYSVYLPGGVELSSCALLTRVDFHRYEERLVPICWLPVKCLPAPVMKDFLMKKVILMW